MKIVVTSGHHYSGLEICHRALVRSGLSEAKRAGEDGGSVETFHRDVLKAHGVDGTDHGPVFQVLPGRVWETLAVDVFRANLALENWGWADAGSLWLLDFWKAFDPQVRFVLAYCPPEDVVAHSAQTSVRTLTAAREVVAGWGEAQQELLRFYYRNKDRCVLANTAAIARSPKAFVEMVEAAFDAGFAFPEEGGLEKQGHFGSLAALVSRPLLGDIGAAQAAYEELEAAADLPLGEDTASRDGDSAWREFQDLLARVEDQEARLAVERHSADAALAEERGRVSELERETKVLQDNVATLQRALSEQRPRLSELEGANGALEENIRVLQRALEEGESRGRHAAELGERVAAADRELEEARRALAQARSDLGVQQGHNADLARENDSVIAQLHQVQEELERYFLRCRELEERREEVKASFGTMIPTDVRYDLRGPVDGENWYDAEGDGRWAGPGPISTLVVPAFGPGQYEIELEVADAMDPDILLGTRLAINGEPVDLALDWDGYPAIGIASYETDSAAADGKWRLTFSFPRLQSPAEQGSDDQRILAIRLTAVRIVAV